MRAFGWTTAALFLLFPPLVIALSGKEPIPTTASSTVFLRTDTLPLFDGSRAFEWLQRQVAVGPRVPGTEAHARCRDLIINHLRARTDSVTDQRFQVTHVMLGPLKLTNIIATFNPSEERRLLLTAHWDSRPWADQDPVEERRPLPVPGANDGASGTAILLQLASVFRDNPPPVGVDLVFFDGEDFGTTGVTSSWCQGSRYFAAHLPESVSYLGAINLDMVGGKNLRILREQHSQRNARGLLDLIFETAAELNLKEFVDEAGSEIYDDHVPLQNARIEAVDLIDLEYTTDGQRLWHTTLDTPEQCSPESLAAVGRLLIHLIYRSSHQL